MSLVWCHIVVAVITIVGAVTTWVVICEILLVSNELITKTMGNGDDNYE